LLAVHVEIEDDRFLGLLHCCPPVVGSNKNAAHIGGAWLIDGTYGTWRSFSAFAETPSTPEDAMLTELLDDEQLAAMHAAFTKACFELGISPDEAGRDRRNELATLMFALREGGETDPEVICMHAVHQLRPPAAGLFHQ
jgi:hypothetical protein